MSFSLALYQEARLDIIESINWYNEEKYNLGFEFYDAVTEQLSLLAHNPLCYSIRFRKVRTTRIKRFPYLIYFKVDEKQSSVIILGVLHTSRNPHIIIKRN